MDVSVIIVNFNTKDLLHECLTSVFADTPPIAFEVLVIDNGSTDGSVEMVRLDFPRVRLIVNQSNEGFAKPSNVGMRQSVGSYVFLLNSDTIVKPGALATLKFFLDAHPEAGACGPMLMNPDGSVQHSVKGFPGLWTHACDMLLLDRLFPGSRFFGRGEMSYFSYNTTQEVDHVMAAAFLVRRGVLERTGMFDERFSIYYNDMDWCYRMKQDGWRIYYVSGAHIIHYHGRTVAQINRDLRYFQEMHNNVMLFYQKHYGRWSVMFYKILLACGFVPRTIGWAVARFLWPSERSRHMLAFSLRSLWIGVRFWSPLPETAVIQE